MLGDTVDDEIVDVKFSSKHGDRYLAYESARGAAENVALCRFGMNSKFNSPLTSQSKVMTQVVIVRLGEIGCPLL